jgi:hypothetical protein
LNHYHPLIYGPDGPYRPERAKGAMSTSAKHAATGGDVNEREGTKEKGGTH